MVFSGAFGGHDEGHVAVCYSSDGSKFITGGSEGNINILSGIDKTDAPEHTFFVDAFNISNILQWDDYVAVASEGWSLQKWGFPDGNKSGFLGKFAGNITHISLNFDKTQILAGSGEFILKITDLSSEEQWTIRGHDAPILRTAFGRKYFASSSCDGSLRVWDASSRECIKTLNIFPKSNDVDLSRVRGAVKFDKMENLIVALENEVVIYSSDNWSELSVLKNGNMKTILELEISHCQKYVIVGCKNGEIFIWNLSTHALNSTLKCVSTPSSIAVHPTEYRFLVGDLKGKWRECTNYLDNTPSDNANDVINSTKAKESGVDKFFDLEAEDLEDWGDDEDQDIVNMDREEEDIQPMSSRHAAILNDEDDIQPTLSRHPGVLNEEDDESNEPSILEMARLPKRSTTPEPEPPQNDTEQNNAEQVYVGPELQEVFQVSSSPEHLKYRYLVWNDVGIITTREEDDSSYINIEFHDSATHHPLHIVNAHGYTLGSLSRTAYALATSGDEGKSRISSVLVNVFSAWSASKEWNVSLPKGENAILLSVSATLIAVTTDLHYVRTWTLGGVQQHIFSLPGDPVTLSCHNNMLSVAHYSGTTLTLSLYDAKKPRLVHSGPLPITPNSTLTWIGFTPGALPLAYDSEGVLRSLLPQGGLMWVPLTDMRVGKRNISDTYWLVSATEEAVKCVLCKGVTYPGVSPRPVVCLVPHSAPLCDAGSERTDLEQKRVLNFVNSYDLNKLTTFQKECKAETIEKDEVTLLLKLMALAIKNNRDYKAFEIAKMMPTKQSLEMASRYATKTGRVLLAQKINNLLRNYDERSEDEDDIYEVTDVAYAPTPFIDTTEPTGRPSNSAAVAPVSATRKRVSHIDETVAPLRLSTKTPPAVADAISSPAPPSPAGKGGPSDANPFSVKSDEVKNTQRRSTSFLDSIETKGMEKEQMKAAKQKSVTEKPLGLTLASFGSKVKLQSVTKTKSNPGKQLSKKPGKEKKKTGYALWFEAQTGIAPKSGPLTWRRLPAEEKEKWLEAAKELEKTNSEPSVCLTNSFTRKTPSISTTSGPSNASSESEVVASTEREELPVSGGAVLEDPATGEPDNNGTDVVTDNSERSVVTENSGTDNSETDVVINNKENVRTSKRGPSSDSDSEEKQPCKSKKVGDRASGEASDQTKNKLAAFQFKKKLK